ncbi:putative quinol monooxygenase [Duganella callida]|uniref:Antibiotic biosynthesis monooxygenase n=1 Tax=Duganella callida TaxID=2561932 RepID=A0A4Y9SEG9_9BURK|nr:putative quinol monooxygenase [Duganella callida]TFW21364.1 antibiotic biosynthesis monooxygenase [Duganella callida]
MEKKLSLVAFLYAQPGKEQELAGRLQSLVERSRAEAGCINYDMHQSDDDPTVFVMYENWTSRAALDLHFEMPYMQELVAALPGLLRAPLDMHYLSMLSTPAQPK